MVNGTFFLPVSGGLCAKTVADSSRVVERSSLFLRFIPLFFWRYYIKFTLAFLPVAGAGYGVLKCACHGKHVSIIIVGSGKCLHGVVWFFDRDNGAGAFAIFSVSVFAFKVGLQAYGYVSGEEVNRFTTGHGFTSALPFQYRFDAAITFLIVIAATGFDDDGVAYDHFTFLTILIPEGELHTDLRCQLATFYDGCSRQQEGEVE